MKTVKFAALCVMVTGFGGFAGAAEYFVDSESGDDAHDGLSAATAWRSLAKVNAATIVGGDVVRFKRGGLWRGSLVPHSGEEGKPVTYTAYGEGVKPIIQQSVDRSKPGDWFEEKPGLWSTLKSDPKLQEKVWSPSANDTWTQSFQNGMKGTVTKVTENGETFCRVTCTGKGAKLAPNYIQVWGPDLKDLPETAVIKLKLRATVPFNFKAVHVMQGNFPYTHSHDVSMKTVRNLGTEWTEAQAFLTKSTKGSLTGTPKFHMNFGDVLPPGASVDVKLEGVWRATVDKSVAIERDVGIFIVNHGEKWGVKKWNNPDWDVPKSEKWQRSVRMENDLDYRYDPEGQRVVVKYPKNPGEAFDSIELAMTAHVISQGGKHDVVYDGLWVRYGAAHGFGGGSTRNLTIRNCDISWIGGGLQFWRRHEKTGKILYPVRFGNGIEFWGACRNNLVERNRLWECYDAATTNQGRYDDEIDVTWRDNVIWNSEYSFEYWNAQLTRNVTFEHNTCVDAGCGWAHTQRPDPNGAHLMYYHNRAATTNFVVRNNIFCRATEWTIRSGLDWRYGLVHDHNLVYNEGQIPVMRWLEGKELKLCTWQDYVGLGFDAHGQFAEAIFRDPARRDYRLKENSPGLTLASDGTVVGARDMPGLDEDQSVPKTAKAAQRSWWQRLSN